MYILIVEDDYLQADYVSSALRSAFVGSTIRRIKTESEFRARLEEIADEPPDVVILDMLLRWTDPSPEMPEIPEAIAAEGLNRAGVRCARLLADDMRTTTIPVILYTILERADLDFDKQSLGTNTVYLRKESDLRSLIDQIREKTGSRVLRSDSP